MRIVFVMAFLFVSSGCGGDAPDTSAVSAPDEINHDDPTLSDVAITEKDSYDALRTEESLTTDHIYSFLLMYYHWQKDGHPYHDRVEDLPDFRTILGRPIVVDRYNSATVRYCYRDSLGTVFFTVWAGDRIQSVDYRGIEPTAKLGPLTNVVKAIERNCDCGSIDASKTEFEYESNGPG